MPVQTLKALSGEAGDIVASGRKTGSSTGMKELDRVLGGGIVPGSLCTGGRRPGHRQIHPAFAGVLQSFSLKKGKILLFPVRNRSKTDPHAAQPDR